MSAQTTSFQDHSVIHLPSSAEGRRDIPCSFREFSRNRLVVEVPESIPLSTVISVEHDDALFLGEVVACASDSQNQWQLQVQVEHVLSGLQSLVMLRARLLDEPMPANRRMAVAR